MYYFDYWLNYSPLVTCINLELFGLTANGETMSKGRTPIHKTDYQIKQIMKYNRDGSPDKQTDRLRNLMRDFRHLQEKRGYGKRWNIHKLGKNEISRLVNDWREEGLSHRTIANRIVHHRWLADKVGRLDQIPSNKDIGIGLRKNAPGYGENKAVEIDRVKLDQIPERERLITELRVEFGLRTKEALKFQYHYATKESDRIQLKGSWTKGGRPREIAITTDRQRNLLARVERHQQSNKDKSMIPARSTFKSYYVRYNETRAAAGLHGHEYRHQWAQDRFLQASGIKAPHADGPIYSELSFTDKQRWDKAAKVVNSELGHGEGREDITATYIGARG